MSEPAPPPPPKKLVLSGPSENPDTRPRTGPQPPEPLGKQDDLGLITRSARTDVSSLRTNRDDGAGAAAPASAEEKIGRNDPCPCGSGKKYKKCHGAGVV